MLTIAAALTIATAATAATNTTNQLDHSQDVVRFFDNHAWLRAPNQPNCGQVPWQKSCTIARKVYRHHHATIRRVKHEMWMEYQYDWQTWLPENWKRVARCETHFNFEHNNSSFVSAFGISWREYNADAAHMGAPPWNVRHTPRDQYKAALGHYDRFGDGWSCPGP